MRHLLPAVVLLVAAAAAAEDTVPLPKLAPWSGRSRTLVRPATDPWITPAEATGFRLTPSYDDTLAFLRRLEAADPRVRLVSLGRSTEGRDVVMAVVSQEGARTADALRANGRPTVLAQAGIHAGEIDGKDAGLMLLRDMSVGKRVDLLGSVNLLFVPILNVDGHERIEPRGRINQRGPENAGWRTNANNLNLNRDYGKLDTPEVRAVVQAITAWDPQLYIDLHVTDGGDYQYDVTFGATDTGKNARSPEIEQWLNGAWRAAVERDLSAAGHVPGPLWAGNPADARDPAKGYGFWPLDVRLSTGYGDARHLPTILVENHSLKPYERRVLGTRVFLESTLRAVAAHQKTLRQAIEADRARRADPVTIAWQLRKEPVMMSMLGISWSQKPSRVTGGTQLVYEGAPRQMTVPVFLADVVGLQAPRPSAYFVPAAWPDVIERLQAHGIHMEKLEAPRVVDVKACRLPDAKIAAEQGEGRVRLDVGTGSGTEPWRKRAGSATSVCALETRKERLPAGSVRVPTDQPLGDLAVLLLEPLSQDSFLQWGFFNSILGRTEYVEAYVMEPLAERLLAEDPKLAAEYAAAVAADPKLAADPDQRLSWIYRRTPWADQRHLLYPVFSE
jgi:murein tripeptide amidase MpaA